MLDAQQGPPDDFGGGLVSVTLNYLSVCSGIEAATQAWKPLGWKPWAFSEIEPFPSAVLAHHYPDVPNLGDMTKFKDWPDANLDVLCGGTPCQSFSVAGLRQGLADPRGNLMLCYLAIAKRYSPRWVVWENVPGVYSSNSHDAPDTRPPDIDLEGGNGPKDGEEVVVEDRYEADEDHAFACFLAGLQEIGYGFAYRTFDAQHVRTCRFAHAVPQRRRRVFVVGYLGDWRRAAAVLFDRESLSGHPAPRRQAGQATARGFECGPQGGRFADVAPTLDASCKDGPVRNQLGAGVITANSGDVGFCLTASAQGSLDAETETIMAVSHTLLGKGNDSRAADMDTYIAHSLRGEGFDASEDGTGRATPLVPVVSGALCRDSFAGGAGGRPEGAAAGHFLPVAFDCKGTEVQHSEGVTPPLRTMGHNHNHQNAGGHAAVAFQDRFRGDDGRGYDRPPPISTEVIGAIETVKPWNIATPWAVRRLTPTECERLMGFPDGFTQIPWRGKPAENCPDGPRYKALGNSWAVNCADWIGERINEVDQW
jgi:DNA (cytosine-5)-methyltransferase 1